MPTIRDADRVSVCGERNLRAPCTHPTPIDCMPVRPAATQATTVLSVGFSAGFAKLPVRSNVQVWDTRHVPPSKAIESYRRALREVYMPCSLERCHDDDFEARLEAAEVRTGVIIRHRCSPHVLIRSKTDIVESGDECTYVILLHSGRCECEQNDRTTLVAPGDILIIDSALPARLTMRQDTFDALVVKMPKSQLRSVCRVDSHCCNVLLKQNRSPLAECLSLMAEHMIGGTSDALTSLYDACRSLLPLEAGCFDNNREMEAASDRHQYLLPGILSYIDHNIADAALTPTRVADEFGISVRYLHKLFVRCGTTFCSYMTARRLDNISKDLISSTSNRIPVSLIALRWGFGDLSTFNRAFKRRFGRSPSQFRVEHLTQALSELNVRDRQK